MIDSKLVEIRCFRVARRLHFSFCRILSAIRPGTTAIFLFLASSPGFAGNKLIEGAFGLKFGQKIDIARLEKPDGGTPDEYLFYPDKPYGPLSRYYVTVQTGTNIIYRIEARGKFKSAKSCRHELDILEQVLARKYGPRNREQANRFVKMPKISFGSGARRIEAVCSGVFGRHVLKLLYHDRELERSGSHKANRPATTGSRDPSGL